MNPTDDRASRRTQVTKIARAIQRLATERDEARSEARYLRGLLARCRYNLTDADLKGEIESHLRETM